MPVPTPEVLMAIDLPAPPLRPSCTMLRRSEEGQIAVVTRLDVHIITPACGINYDLGSSQYATPLAPGELRDGSALKIFRTVAEMGSFRHHAWATDLGGPSTNSLGSLGITCKSVAWSPANVSISGTCLLALLTTNLEVFIYDSPKNYLSGEWRMITPLTLALFEYSDNPHLSETRGTDLAKKVLQAQITCMDWSQQVISPPLPSNKDLSFLALGNRASQIILWRYHRDGPSSFEAITRLNEEWVTDVCWTPWIETSDGQVISTIACALADGSIKLVNVKQLLDTTGDAPVDMTQSDGWVHPPDSRIVTGLAWIELQYGGSPVLVYSKPGMIYAWSPPGSGRPWDGSRSFLLKKQPVSLGSSSLHPPSGFDYVRSDDSLLVTVSDGSFHLVYHMSTDPTLEAPDPMFTSLSVTRKARAVFVEIEDAENIASAAMQTYGGSFVSYGTVLWIYRKIFPTYMNYVPDLTQISCLALAPLWQCQESHSQFLADVAALVSNPISVARRSLTAILFPFYLYLRNHKGDPALQEGLEKTFNSGFFDASDAERRRSRQRSPVKPLSAAAAQESLTTDIIDGPCINSLRIRLALAKLAALCGFELEDQMGLCRRFLRANVLCGLAYCIADDPSYFREYDLSSAQRIIRICRAFTFPTPQAKALFMDLSSSLSIPISEARSAVPGAHVTIDGSAASIDLGELCPVCKTAVILDDLESGRCPNGHVWERCSVTTIMMATPYVRTCVSCSRKAHLPPSQLPPGVTQNGSHHGWFFDLLLESARCCVYCGGRFVKL